MEMIRLNTAEKFNSLGKCTTDRHIPLGCFPISYIDMCRPQRVCFLSRFGQKTDIDFDHYGLESGMVFREP